MLLRHFAGAGIGVHVLLQRIQPEAPADEDLGYFLSQFGAVGQHALERLFVQQIALYIAVGDHRRGARRAGNEFIPRVERVEYAIKNSVFNPNPSGLCRAWCPVPRSKCEFSGKA